MFGFSLRRWKITEKNYLFEVPFVISSFQFTMVHGVFSAEILVPGKLSRKIIKIIIVFKTFTFLIASTNYSAHIIVIIIILIIYFLTISRRIPCA